MSRGRQVRFFNPASIQIGDLIAVTTKSKDVEIRVMGRVAKRDYEGSRRVLTTSSGYELLCWHPGYDKQCKITLIDSMPVREMELDLFGDQG